MKKLAFITVLLSIISCKAFAEQAMLRKTVLSVNHNLFFDTMTQNVAVYIMNDKTYLDIDCLGNVLNLSYEMNDTQVQLFECAQKAKYVYDDIGTNRYGYLDKSGNILCDPIYAQAGLYSEDLAIGYIEGDVKAMKHHPFVTYMDQQGETRIYSPFNYFTGNFHQGIAIGGTVDNPAASSQRPVFSAIDRQGNTVDFPLKEAQPVDVTAKKSDYDLYFDSRKIEANVFQINHKIYLPLRDIAEYVGFQVLWDSLDTCQKIELDSFQPKKIEAYDTFGRYAKDGESFHRNRVYDINLNRFGYLASDNTLAIPFHYIDAYDFSDGVALVCEPEKINLYDYDDNYEYEQETNGNYYYIDQNGNQAFDKKFEYARSFSDGYAAVVVSGNVFPTPSDTVQWTFIDLNGNIATTMVFEDVRSFCNGYAMVKQNGKWGVINKEFKFVIKCQYSWLVDMIKDHNFLAN